MSSASARFAAMLGGAAGALARVARAIGNPDVAPSVNVPGVPRAQGSPSNIDSQLASALRTPDAFFGRLTYDAGPAWTRFSSYPATNLTPEIIIGAQREAVAGYPLRWAELIEQLLGRDGHYAGITQQRVDDVVKGTWRLVRATPDDVGAAVRGFCEEAIRGIDNLDDAMGWLLYGNAYGYGVAEVVWTEDRIAFAGPKGERIGPVDVVVPRLLEAVHPKHIRFDMRTDEPLLWLGTDQVSFPFGKFCFFKGEGQSPITERRGHGWQCCWYSMFRSIGWAGWATFVERFGLPTPIVRYDGDVAQYNEYKQAYADILNNLGQGFGAIVPQSAQIDNFQVQGGGRASDPHSALSDACDAAQSIRVLGATLTAKIGNVGSFAASSTHAEVKYAREEADARRLWSTLRGDLLAPLVYFNAPALAEALSDAGYHSTPDMLRRRIPRGMHRVPREIDPRQSIEIVDIAVNKLGVKVSLEGLYDRFDLPQPLNEDDVAPGAPEPVSSGGALVGTVEAAHEGAEAPKDKPTQAAPGSAQRGSA